MEIVKELFKQCGLPEDFMKRYPHEVSGGQCQRAAIARAIAIKPRLLILDEATSALDVTVQAEILQLLDALQEERQMSYLFICHDIALVQNFCDRVLVMYQGKIVEQGKQRKCCIFRNTNTRVCCWTVCCDAGSCLYSKYTNQIDVSKTNQNRMTSFIYIRLKKFQSYFVTERFMDTIVCQR